MIRAALILALAAGPALAQAKNPATTKSPATKGASTAPEQTGKTTLSGVYTREEADYGKEMFASLCSNCHPIAQHATPIFRKKWNGRPLSELYTYIKTSMPKSEPGSLADEDYALLLAYLLQSNRMPAGRTALSTDTLELAKIRFDTVRAVAKP